MGLARIRGSRRRTLRKLDPNVAPVIDRLGVLGMPGMTAYFGFLDICIRNRARQCWFLALRAQLDRLVADRGKSKAAA